MAQIILTNGTTKDVQPKNGKKFSLSEAQKAVGGYVQLIRLDHQNIMLVNEDGKLQRSAKNLLATTVAHNFAAIFPNDFIVGDVLVCKNNEF